jgi:hypothetical protein
MPRPTTCFRASMSGISFWSSAGSSEMTKTMLGECRLCTSMAMLSMESLLLGMIA